MKIKIYVAHSTGAAMDQPTRPTQPSIHLGSVNE